MGVMKEERKEINGEINKRQIEQEELRGWYARQEILQSGVISDVKQRKDWTGRDHRRSLGTDRSQGSKKFLIAVIKSRDWMTEVCSWVDVWCWISEDWSREFCAMLERTRAVSRWIPSKCRWQGAEKLCEHTKNLVVFKEESHKRKRDYPVYYSEIKTYYLAITMNKMPKRPSKRVPSIVRCWASGLFRKISRSGSAVGLKLIWFCTNSTGEKGLWESDEAFFKSPDYNFPKTRRKIWGPRNRGFYTNRLWLFQFGLVE